MTERDWEGMARVRLERNVANTVSRVREMADQIEREARRNIEAASTAERKLEFQTYPRVAGQVVHTVQTMLFNLKLDSLIDAAADAEAARTEKRGPADPMTDRASIALGAVLSAIEDWETNWKREDIERMVDDAAREVGARMTPLRTEEKGRDKR